MVEQVATLQHHGRRFRASEGLVMYLALCMVGELARLDQAGVPALNCCLSMSKTTYAASQELALVKLVFKILLG